MFPRMRSPLVPLLLILLLAPATLLAQASVTGRIEGRVVDETTEEPLPGAIVSLIGPQRTEPQTTNADGFYRFPGVPVGTYDLAVTLEGYQPVTYTEIQIDPDATREFDFRLDRSRREERILVKAKPNVVNLRETSVKETIDSRYVNRVPLTSRRFQEILSLFPGVARSEGTTLAQFTVQGGREREVGWRLDGATINDHVTGTFGANLPQNSIERFELLLNGFQAEYGENNSGVANIITKSGTNEWEFFVSEVYRSDDLILTSHLDELRDLGAITDFRPETQNWLELSVGGPIVKDKTFFFLALQHWREDIGNPFQPKIRKGDRYYGLFKLDHIFNDRNRLTLTVNTDPAEFERVLLEGGRSPEANADSTQGGYIINLRDDHTFTDRVFLSSQLSIHHQYLTLRPTDPTAGPYVIDASQQGTLYTGTYFNNQDRSTDQIRLSEKITLNLGDRREHLVKIGADLGWQSFDGHNRADDLYIDYRDLGPDPFGPIDFNGDGQPDWIAQRYNFGDEIINDTTDQKYALFIQDTYTPNRRWTLDMGLRFDYQTAIADLEISPRFGLSFDILGDGDQKLYMNIGRFYHDVITDIQQWKNAFAIQEELLIFDGDSGSRVPEPTMANGILDVLTFAPQSYIVDGDLDTPYKDQWTIGYAIALPWQMRFEANYTQWDGEDQILTLYDPATGENIVSSSGRAEYRGWNFILRKYLSNRVEFMVNYTNSVVRGEDYETFGFIDLGDPLLQRRESRFARLRSDRTHIINASALFDIPGGWELTTVYHFATGRAISLDNGADIVGTRNDERLPSFRQWDIGVARNFKWGDDNEVKLLAQVLNIFNSFNVVESTNTNVNLPEEVLLDPTQVDLGRIVQVGFELRF